MKNWLKIFQYNTFISNKYGLVLGSQKGGILTNGILQITEEGMCKAKF